MKALYVMAAVGLSLVGSTVTAPAQYGGGYGGGYDRPYRGEREYRERDYGERDRGPRYRGGGFDEEEYLRCNPDVRRAVNRGTMPSAAVHYRQFGRREGRRLSC